MLTAAKTGRWFGRAEWIREVHVHVPIPCKEPDNIHMPFQSMEMGLVLWWHAGSLVLFEWRKMCKSVVTCWWVENSQVFHQFTAFMLFSLWRERIVLRTTITDWPLPCFLDLRCSKHSGSTLYTLFLLAVISYYYWLCHHWSLQFEVSN